jgi:glycosyltransferase involved in cell wall biosynthesis
MHRSLRQLKPQIVHFHDPHGLTGGGLAAWKMHGVGRIASRKVDFPVHAAWRYQRLADRVIAVSSAVAAVCIASGLAAESIRIVHDGVDPQRAHCGDRARGRLALGLSAEDILLLTVAKLTGHKGHTFLLQAMPAVLAKHPRAILALAGDGELRESLEAEARQLGIEQAVRFLGYRSDVPDLVKAADLFVMPSIMEGLCSTLIDVMFARVPIVSTTAGGIPDLVGQLGAEPPVAAMVRPHDPAALAGAIHESFSDRSKLAELVDRAERRAHEHFTADHMVEKTIAVYREVLAAR